MALTTEQQTSHLSRLQQEVLSWDYFTMDDGQTRSDATRKRALRDVPKTFASVNEYLDVFEPLVLEECAAQISRGDEEETRRSSGSTIGAVFRSTRVDGFHVVQFILGEDAMAGFHDNDLILVSKTDPNEALPERAPDGRDADADAAHIDAETEDDPKSKSKSTLKTSTSIDDPYGDPEGLHNVHALGYVDGRDSRNMMRVRFFLPEPSSAVRSAVSTAFLTRETVTRKPPVVKRGKETDANENENEKTHQDGKSEEDFVRFRAVRNALASPKSAWYLTHLANMSTIAREWLALRAFPSLPFAHAILGGKVEASRGSKPGGDRENETSEHAPWELPEPLAAAMKRAYNESQLRAVSAALEKQPITLIQGPPGTGKTRIVLSLLSAILHASPGSANARFGHETDLKKFLSRREDAPRRKADAKTVVKNHRAVSPWMRGAENPRDAPPEATHFRTLPTETTYSFQRPETPEIVGESARRRTKVLVCAPSNAALDEIVMRIMHTGLLGPDGNAYSPTLVRVGVNAHRGVEKVSMETLVRERVGSDDEESDERDQNASEKKFERALERDRVKLAILDEASVVCSTLSFSGSGMFARMTKKFDVVVVDEAAQAVEPSTLVPLCYGAKQCFLVGDPKQLPATVLSSAATAKGYTRSLFKRFEECGYPVYLLKTQYRMHPEIRRFPSSAFYGDALEDGPAMRRRATRPWHGNPLFRPFVFFDIAGTERRPDGASWANDDEARFVAALVKRLISDHPSLLNEDEISGAGVGVISPYKAQVKVIRKLLEQALGPERARFVDVNSVDGFQGREKEVCVFSVTRAPRTDKKHSSAAEGTKKKNLLGFVADERRVNVGLTRARSSLLVVGSAKALQTDANWGGLVKSATERRLIVKPTGGKTAAAFDAFVAKHSARYDEDDLSGDDDDLNDAAIDDDDDETNDVRLGETETETLNPSRGLGLEDDDENERKKHVHKPEWTGAVGKSAAERRDDAAKARAARDDDDDDAVGENISGFAPEGVRDELVTEASNVRGVGQADDYAGPGNDEDDGDLDAFAQAPEPAAKKRTAGARRAPTEKISNASEKKRGAEKTATGAPPKRARGKK